VTPGLEIRPATAEDAAHVARFMRAADVAEARGLSNMGPFQATCAALYTSERSQCATLHGDPILLFGCANLSILGRYGSPWLLGTDRVEEVQRAMLEVTRQWVDGWRRRYDLLENVADGRNTKSLGWLRRLGFKLDPPVTLPNGVPAVRFTAERLK
jgi:hypothetical protein